MKSTIARNNTANPKRVTLTHLEGAEALIRPRVEETTDVELPAQTANPRRTVLAHAPNEN
ncbi:hypothetical protein [Streptomyces sp. NPDC005438]|uniref:hypothetical protein n=1 Tax=Streptomyces sp. NPDC005438 TaxID=3156880 RepID=UPI0033B241B1